MVDWRPFWIERLQHPQSRELDEPVVLAAWIKTASRFATVVRRAFGRRVLYIGQPPAASQVYRRRAGNRTGKPDRGLA
jgi:hypothetical protein